jgi:adenosylcobyric acid synthase
MADLAWLREMGLADWIVRQHRSGTTIVGICGGYQMLGRMIHDPLGMESSAGSAEGLGLLPAVTWLSSEKQTQAVTATTPGGAQFGGYEIHLGVTTLDRRDAPFARLDAGGIDGVRAPGVIGTYLHGAFEHPDVCAEVFGIDAPSGTSKAAHYERLATWFEQHVRHRDQLGLG